MRQPWSTAAYRTSSDADRDTWKEWSLISTFQIWFTFNVFNTGYAKKKIEAMLRTVLWDWIVGGHTPDHFFAFGYTEIVSSPPNVRITPRNTRRNTSQHGAAHCVCVFEHPPLIPYYSHASVRPLIVLQWTSADSLEIGSSSTISRFALLSRCPWPARYNGKW